MKTALFLALFTFVATPAFAQKRNADARHELRARISEAVTTRVATAVGLDAATTAKVKAIVAKHAVILEGYETQMGEARRGLRQLVASRSNDVTALTQASDALLAAVRQHDGERQARQAEIRAAVTPSQFAMLLLETPRIEREVRKEMMSAAGRGDEE